ncbi:MAG: DUF6789 family protein [Haloferacaceae archaeon]
MSTATEQDGERETSTDRWTAGLVGGAGGALAMGAAVLAMNAPTLAVAIPSLYGLAPPPNPVVGMGVHVVHGAVLGVVFAGVVERLSLDSSGTVVGASLAWGVVTWVVLAALVMPVWLGAVGSPASPPFPNFAVPSLLWHLIYGGVLGGVYLAIERRP